MMSVCTALQCSLQCLTGLCTVSRCIKTVHCVQIVLCVVQQKDEVYLNLVLEFVPETVYRVARHYSKNKQVMLPIYIKVSQSVSQSVVLLVAKTN